MPSTAVSNPLSPRQKYDLDNVPQSSQLVQISKKEKVHNDRLREADTDSLVHRPPARQRPPRPIFTYLMMLICTLGFVYEMKEANWHFAPSAVNPTYGPSIEVLLKCGAQRTDLIKHQGEYWRLVSPMFLHAGILHLVFNMFSLRGLGMDLEMAFGPCRVGILYLVSGFYGSLASAVFVPTAVGVGASGAIFGLLGGAVSDFVQNYEKVEHKCYTAMQLLLCVVINLGIGLMPFLNNFAHVGGFVAGALMGLWLLVEKRTTRSSRSDMEVELEIRGYQFCLMMVAWVVLFLLLVIGLYFTLLQGVDAHGWCTWCRHLNCIETPWWTCSMASGCSFGYNGTTAEHSYTCPAGSSGAEGGMATTSTTYTSPDIPKCFTAHDGTLNMNTLQGCYDSNDCKVGLCESCCFFY